MTQHFFVIKHNDDIIGIVSLLDVPPNAPVKDLEDSGEFGYTFSNIISVIFNAFGVDQYYYLGTVLDEEMMIQNKRMVTIPWMFVINRD